MLELKSTFDRNCNSLSSFRSQTMISHQCELHLIWNDYTGELAKQVYVPGTLMNLIKPSFSLNPGQRGQWIRSGGSQLSQLLLGKLNKLTLNFSLIPWWSGCSLAEQALGMIARQLSFWNNDEDYTNLQSHFSQTTKVEHFLFFQQIKCFFLLVNINAFLAQTMQDSFFLCKCCPKGPSH